MPRGTLTIEQNGSSVKVQLKHENGDTQGSEYGFASEDDATTAVVQAIVTVLPILNGSLTDTQAAILRRKK